MKESLSNILVAYLPSKKSPFGSHPLANSLRHTVPVHLAKELSLSAAYKVKGSAGQGNWAEIPWIGIFDKDITTSAERGYYIVYLFRADMKGVYLCLNLGWTQFEENFTPVSVAKNKISEARNMLRDKLHSFSGFDLETIDLATQERLGVGYQLGYVCGKYYEFPSLPKNDILTDDLRTLMSIYLELKGKLAGKSLFQELNDYNYEHANVYVSEGEAPKTEDLEKVNQLSEKIQAPEELDDLLKKIEEMMEGRESKKRQRIAYAVVRNQKIVELVKKKAGYTCEICKLPGFEKRKGGLYAEVHHVEELGKEGRDLPSNMICVCPLCHRKIHYGKRAIK